MLELQFGRAVEGADDATVRGRGGAGVRRFNSAAPLKARMMSASTLDAAISSAALQFGRAVEGADDYFEERPDERRRDLRLQFGRAVEGADDDHDQDRENDDLQRFNSAAPLKARMIRPPASAPAVRAAASIRPRR